MKLYYDNIIFNLQSAGGISTYWGELIKRHLLDKVDIKFINYDNENIVFKNLSLNADLILNEDFKFNFIKRFSDINLFENDRAIFHSSYNRVAKSNAFVVHTVHDFIHEKYYSGPRKWIHKYQKDRSIISANKIIAISNNTKKDLLEYYPKLKEENIETIYNGVSNDFFPLDECFKTFDNYPYFLFIGSRVGYKNFSFSVEFVKFIKDYRLYIVGGKLTEHEIKFLNEMIPGRWKLFSNINNTELNILYNNAFALIYPSDYEGFGIPVLEAMKAGTPVLALRSSSIPEVAGEAGVLIDKIDINLFSDGFKYIENNRSKIIDSGYVQASKFSWDKCYSQTINLYKNLI